MPQTRFYETLRMEKIVGCVSPTYAFTVFKLKGTGKVIGYLKKKIGKKLRKVDRMRKMN